MTDEECAEITQAVGAVLAPYAATGKIAGFRMVVAVWREDHQVSPMIIGSHINAEVGKLFENPEFVFAEGGNLVYPKVN